MMTLEVFKKLCGMDKIQLFQGKGREFAPTPVGTLFVAKNIDHNKERFVTINDGSLNPELKGTYWLVNAGAKETRTI